MPESFQSLPEVRCSVLEKFVQSNQGAGLRCMTLSNCGNPGGGHHLQPALSVVHTTARITKRGKKANPKPTAATPRPLACRRPGTSQYYGVRFRSDLGKWVAEIRVAEWKPLDKKVWLGTYDSQQAAARGVDLARKLLKCAKKQPPNLPCAELCAYAIQIPPHLNLRDFASTSMFKETTNFIKLECRKYAASFSDGGDPYSTTPATNKPASSTTRALGFDPPPSSEVLDFGDCGSEFSDLVPAYDCCNGATVTNEHPLDGFEVDSYPSAKNSAQSDELGVSSSPSSCNSLGSCLTLEAFPGQEAGLEWELGAGGCDGESGMFCCVGNVSAMIHSSRNISEIDTMMPEMVEGVGMMEAMLTEQLEASVASQLWEEDHFWPALLEQDSSAFLNDVPGCLHGSRFTPFNSPVDAKDILHSSESCYHSLVNTCTGQMLYWTPLKEVLIDHDFEMPGGFTTAGDLDAWTLPGAPSYPFPNGLHRWP